MGSSGSRFARAARLRRGYAPEAVDAFLDRVEPLLAGGAAGPAGGSSVSAAEIRRAGFELRRGGYVVRAVDAHLDDLERRAVDREGDAHRPRGAGEAASPAALARLLSGPRGQRFPRSGRIRRGYSRRDVDDFLDGIGAGLRGDVAAGLPALTPATVRGAVFRARLGGYAEGAVDDTLGELVDILLRRERASARHPGASPVGGR